MNTIISLLKKKPKISGAIAILIIILIVSSYFYFSNGSNGTETLIVKKSDFIQTVSVAGKVVASQDVDLGFNQSGKISRITAKVGDIVKAGQLIAEIDSRDAALSLEESRVALQKLVKPAEKFDKITAENALQEAKDATLTANNDLIKAYSDGLSAVANSFVDFPTILEGLDNLLNNYNTSSYISSFTMSNYTARNYRDKASDSYWIAKRAYDINVSNYQKINRTTAASSTIEAIIKETYKTTQLIDQAVKDTNTAVKFVVDQNSYYSDRTTQMTTDLSNLAGWTGEASASLLSLSSINNTLTSANDTLNNSSRSVAAKEEALRKLIDGPDEFDIEAKQLAVEQKAKIYADYFIRAPFDGVVTRIDTKIGELVTPNTSPISMISQGTFQIESYVPEINIAGLKVNNPAKVTLDAYGQDTYFDATVISIDPAETIRDGVSTYKIKLQFNNEDQRIRSGMTANIVITAENKKNVFVVPASAIFSKDNQKFVMIKNNGKQLKQPVVAGSVGVLGQTEIISGVKEGDLIILNPVVE